MSERTEAVMEMNRLTSKARNAAVRRLVTAHQEEYRVYYDEEARALGIATRGSLADQRARKAARLRAQLATLEEQSAASSSRLRAELAAIEEES